MADRDSKGKFVKGHKSLGGRPISMRLCNEANCSEKHQSKGYCKVHAQRLRRTGKLTVDWDKIYEKARQRMKNRIVSEETKRKISENHRGTQSPETRAKISASTKGKKISIETRLKQSEAKKGAKSGHLWKGGISPINKIIRGSVDYHIWRAKVFERDNYTCQFCGVRGVELNADHVMRFSDYPELRFELSNGRTLCVPCHIQTPTFSTRKKTGN